MQPNRSGPSTCRPAVLSISLSPYIRSCAAIDQIYVKIRLDLTCLVCHDWKDGVTEDPYTFTDFAHASHECWYQSVSYS
jgi:hypothetical protein